MYELLRSDLKNMGILIQKHPNRVTCFSSNGLKYVLFVFFVLLYYLLVDFICSKVFSRRSYDNVPNKELLIDKKRI